MFYPGPESGGHFGSIFLPAVLSAKKSVDICAFQLTDWRLRNAIVDLLSTQEGVKVPSRLLVWTADLFLCEDLSKKNFMFTISCSCD